ncbi:4'-phosphopantetheinyl transferase superfamily protein [Algoriphagus halophytocola]|uniref:4'-phosphopantetheinyl transferase superfamily protein n=1 Tax=Algoriphagus halophytocola TaxID=2991499 RepID=A0ABY6MH44_9BACT|nr:MULTISPECIES: 4'-phosphopantetheinyl transferase superfamily protein [unclassified Algoriphagus]UZD22804.1 4'-phosphopantetheinyl transferase superfamily protein [Algoriphagus sp. TR-M5]WBL45107.1 4'-phosphopantetheinyl transferase superfamily protein [Algoriphagus sp. TR-M9]
MQTKIEKIDASSALAIKNIEPQNDEALKFLSFRERLSLANISHPKKKQEWATARMAVYDALNELQVPYPGFFKDKHGKSQSMNGQGNISLTHTMGYAAAIYHRDLPVGIDMDLVREKILKIGTRFLDSSELDFLAKDPLHYTLAWSAKESIFKCQGKRGVSFRDNILLEPFDQNATLIKAKIRGTDYADHHYFVKARIFENVVLTYTIW